MLSLVLELLRAHRYQDWDRLRELLHPDARIGVVAAGGKPTDVDTAIEAMRRAHSTLSYTADVERTVVIDERAVLLEGTVAHIADDGHFKQDTRFWLYVFVDDLLYRSEVFTSETEALSAYRAKGPDLGV